MWKTEMEPWRIFKEPESPRIEPTQKVTKKKKKTTEEKRKALMKIKTNIVTDRNLNLIYKDKTSEVFIAGELDYKLRWMLDVWADEIVKKSVVNLSKKERKELLLEKDEYKYLLADYQNIVGDGSEVPTVKLTENQIRKRLGFSSTKLSNEEIYDLVYNKLPTLRIKGFWDVFDEEEGYIKYKVHGGLFSVVIKEKMKEKKGRYETEKRTYLFRMQDVGFLIWQNFLRNRFSVLPRPFYKLSKNAQEIYRKIVQFNATKYKVSTLRKILDYKETEDKTLLYRYRKSIEKAIKELKKEGFLKHYTKEKIGEDSVYTLIPNKTKEKTK